MPDIKTVKPVKIAGKWFFPLQKMILEKMKPLYITARCLYQIVEEERVIEMYLCVNKKDEPVQVAVHMLKRPVNDMLMIYEMTLVASN